MAVKILSWFALGLSLLGAYLINKKRIEGFYVWILANAIWIVINYLVWVPAQMILFTIYQGFNIHIHLFRSPVILLFNYTDANIAIPHLVIVILKHDLSGSKSIAFLVLVFTFCLGCGPFRRTRVYLENLNAIEPMLKERSFDHNARFVELANRFQYFLVVGREHRIECSCTG